MFSSKFLHISGIIQIALFILIMFVEGKLEFFNLNFKGIFLKEIVENVVFKSTLAYLSITNSIFGFYLVSKNEKTFVRETLYL